MDFGLLLVFVVCQSEPSYFLHQSNHLDGQAKQLRALVGLTLVPVEIIPLVQIMPFLVDTRRYVVEAKKTSSDYIYLYRGKIQVEWQSDA